MKDNEVKIQRRDHLEFVVIHMRDCIWIRVVAGVHRSHLRNDNLRGQRVLLRLCGEILRKRSV